MKEAGANATVRRSDQQAAVEHRSTARDTSPSLDAIEIFKTIAPDSRIRFERRCRWRRYQPGEPIIGYLDTSNEVFFLAAGQARVSIYSSQGKTITFCDLRPGDMFGEYAAIHRAPRSTSVEAQTECLVASMTATAFQEMLQSEPSIMMGLIQHLVEKVRALTTRVYEFSALAVSNRIQAEVLRLAYSAPRDSAGAHISPAPTHTDIANRTSTHREAVTRELNRLSKLGIIERRARTLTVKNMQRLAAMVREATGE